MRKKMKYSAAYIPNTKRHLAFLGEVQDALKVSRIPYKTEIIENLTEQYSEVHFFTPTQRSCDNVAALIELVSVRAATPKEIGKKIGMLYKAGQ